MDLRVDGVALNPLMRRRKPFAVFCYLALDPTGRFLQRDHLCGVFWPESSQERARASLRQALVVIRKALPGILETRGDEEVRVRPGTITSDLGEYRAAVKEGRVNEARGLNRGDAFKGFHVPGADGFEDWVSRVHLELSDLRKRVGEGTALPRGVSIMDDRPRGTTPDRDAQATTHSGPGPSSQSAGWWRWAAAAALAVIVAASFADFSGGANNVPAPSAIAVTTPAYLGADADGPYLARGLQDELIAQLARNPSLEVVPAGAVRTAERAVAGSANAAASGGAGGTAGHEEGPRVAVDVDADRLTKALGARYQLESSIQRDGHRYRLAVSLVDWQAHEITWSETFETASSGLLDLRSEVAARVAAALTIGPVGTALSYSGATPGAMPHYYIALGLMGSEGGERARLARWLRAEEHLDTALDSAPDFAAAWAKRAHLGFRRFWLGSDASREGVLRAQQALARATQLDPTALETRLATAYHVYHVDRHWPRAAQLARDLAPELDAEPDVTLLWASAERRQGNLEEAARILDARIARRPLETPIHWGDLFNTYRVLRRWEDAERVLRHREETSGAWACGARYSSAYDFARTPEDLDRVVEECRARNPNAFRGANEFWHEFRMRRFDQALAAVDSLEARRRAAGEERPGWLNQQWAPFPLDLWRGLVYERQGDDVRARKTFARHIPELERLVDEFPELALRGQFLASAYAGAGRRDDALREAGRALDAALDEQDHWYGVYAAYEWLSRIHADLGNVDESIEILEEHLTTGPAARIRLPQLRIDPIYDPLRASPRFRALVERLEAEESSLMGEG